MKLAPAKTDCNLEKSMKLEACSHLLADSDWNFAKIEHCHQTQSWSAFVLFRKSFLCVVCLLGENKRELSEDAALFSGYYQRTVENPQERDFYRRFSARGCLAMIEETLHRASQNWSDDLAQVLSAVSAAVCYVTLSAKYRW
jgi:hypothetical protein